MAVGYVDVFFFSSRRRHTRSLRDWSSDVCSSDLLSRARLGRRRRRVAARPGELPTPAGSAFHLADRKSTRLNYSHVEISYAVFCLKKKKKQQGVNEPVNDHA